MNNRKRTDFMTTSFSWFEAHSFLEADNIVISTAVKLNEPISS